MDIARLDHYALRALLCAIALMLSAGPAAADWTVYVSGDIGISTATGKIDGTQDFTGAALPYNDSDGDSSPMIAGAVGIAIPWSELMAWELPYDLRLPEWPVRMELEFAGLREFEFQTQIIQTTPPAPQQSFFASSSSWSMMVNFWFDLPVRSFYRPLRAMGARMPRNVRDALDPISFYGGVGLGTSQLTFKTLATIPLVAEESDFRFAWQAGAGMGYAVTKFVSLTGGYRYFKTEGYNTVLADNVGTPRGTLSFQEDIHEFRASVRVNVYSFRNPWLLLK